MNIFTATDCCGEVVNLIIALNSNEVKLKDVLESITAKLDKLHQLCGELDDSVKTQKAFIFEPERNTWEALENATQLIPDCQLYFTKSEDTIPHYLPKAVDLADAVKTIKSKKHVAKDSTTSDRRSCSPDIDDANKNLSNLLKRKEYDVTQPHLDQASADHVTTSNTKEARNVINSREVSILREERDKFERQLEMSVDELRQNLKREMEELERSLSRSTSRARDVIC